MPADIDFRAELAAARTSRGHAAFGGRSAARGDRRRPSRPVRLLHVFTSFNTGGAQVRFVSLAKALGPDYSHAVLALTGDYEASTLVDPGVEIRYLTPPDPAQPPLRLLRYRRLLNRVGPDLLLTYNWGAIEFALANLAGSIPHLHHEDGFGPEEATRQFRRRVWLRRLALHRSHVFVPSETLRRLAEREWRLNARRLHHIPNGIAPSPTPAGVGRPSPNRTTPPKIVWVGALRPEKNALRMIEAFAPIKDQASLIIVGDGPDRGALLESIRARGLEGAVQLLGRRQDAREIIQEGDVLALSSDTEQMPLVVLEAMDAGLPVASVDVGDVRRMLAPENRPFVTEISSSGLTRALSGLLGNAELRRAVGEANRRHVAAAYRHDVMVDSHRRLLDGLLTGELG